MPPDLPSVAETRIINLWAADGRVSMPDGNSIYIWGFTGQEDASAQLPGPHLVVTQGETVVVKLTNTLPESVSIRFPGVENVMVVNPDGSETVAEPQYQGGKLVSLVNYAPPGDSITYKFVAAHPGTYLYESGTDPHKQVPMGLYGAMVVRPADYHPENNKTAYGAGTGTEFDREYLLVVGEIDPALHRAVETGEPYDMQGYKPRYWTINGRAAPDTMLPDRAGYLPAQPYGCMIMAEPGERVLLRYAGAGVDHHPLHPHGNHTRVVAVDGRLLKNESADLSFDRFTVLVGAGQTYDQIFTWTGLGFTPANPIPTTMPNLRNLAVGHVGWTMWSGSPYLGEKGDIPVGITSFNRMGEYHFMLHSHEEPQITNWGEFPGGMMTMIAIYPPGTLGPEMGCWDNNPGGYTAQKESKP